MKHSLRENLVVINKHFKRKTYLKLKMYFRTQELEREEQTKPKGSKRI
jgi:hypothetical protein